MAETQIAVTGGDTADTARPSRVGQLVAGKYKLVRLLGEGGMGAVYEAQHVVIQRRFAVKFVHTELARRGEIIARFRREAQAAGSLENENIAAITDVGTADDGAPFIIMEYLTGADLSAVLATSGPLPVPRAAHLLIQACRGLDAAHARGITHRDLKPENLFVCKRGDGSDLVKVLDFGIAKLRDGDGAAATQTGSAIGTPFYMPPEQARGSKELDHRADIYALGVILYELLSCAKPHPGDGYNAILFHILTQPPTPLDSLRSGLPEGLVAVVEKAMAADAADRFQSVMELAHALAPFVGRAITPHNSSEDLPAPRGTGSSENMATMATPVSLTELPATDRVALSSPGTDRTSISRGSSHTVPNDTVGGQASPPKSKLVPIVGGVVAVLAVILGVVVLMGTRHGTEAAPAVVTGAPGSPHVSAEVSAPVSGAASAAVSADTAPAVSAPVVATPAASEIASAKPAKDAKDAKAIAKPKGPKPPVVDPYAP